MNTEVVKAEIAQTLRHGMSPAAQRMARRSLGRLEQAFWIWPDIDKDLPDWAEPVETVHRVCEFLRGHIAEQSARLDGLRLRYAEYTRRLAETVTLQERQQQILNFARELGASRRDCAADRRAFARWFDHSAVVDRYNYQHAEIERQISTALERLGVMSRLILEKLSPREGEQVTWDRLALERSIRPLLVHNGDARIRVAAFHCLAAALRALPTGKQEGYVTESTLQYIYRSALNPRAHVWIQYEALVLLQDLSPTSLTTALQNRLRQAREGDDMFVRHRAVNILARNLDAIPSLIDLLEVVYQDHSAFVRQGLAEALVKLPREHVCAAFATLCEHDPSPQVRAAAINGLPQLITTEQNFEDLLGMLCARLRDEQDPFVIRVGLHAVEHGHLSLLDAKQHAQAERWCAELAPELDTLRAQNESMKVRRWAALTTERLWSNAEVKRRELKWQLKERLSEVKPGTQKSIATDHLSEFDTATLGRVLSVLAQDGYDWGVMRGRNRLVLRNHRHRFRFWRWLYELRHPSTDKRQAHRHTTGRVFYGNLIAPSARMAELSETKVPGEPLYIAPEDGWRPYLPLVDQLFSCMDESKGQVTIYTAEGTTRIRAPHSPLKWLRARIALVRNFAHFADLRNWQEDSQANPNTYVNEARRLGFDIEFRGHPSETEFPRQPDPSVSRFFALTPPFGVSVSWEQFKEYFFSIYENSLYELGIFTAALAALFIGRHVYLNRALRKARQHIPLVVGGWGTRGKSGTERLKSGLFNALGYSVVSKTTGCEAMFLHGMPFGQLREMFLFRPYDKATIWEQANVLRLAQELDAEVFLWECMGLQPVYVEILQRQWMRDDIATITNTYPDHEDLQGPAGINVAETISRFIPPRSTVLASEEQMLPVLKAVAREAQTECKAVGWLEAGMLTNDVMERFPYEEHPYNVALVLAMAGELGIEPVYAVKEIADRVVPDLGVLKTYPRARVQDRFLEFIMGNSANERLGCLTNWTRMGLDKQDIYDEPHTWVTTVVNNRADRVARSRVFANILVEDISVDRHFLIGTNLKGLRGYIEEAWQDHIGTVTLWPETHPDEPLAVLEQAARRMRIPLSEEHVRARLTAMLDGLEITVDPSLIDHLPDLGALKTALDGLDTDTDVGRIVAHTEQNLNQMQRYTEFAARVGSSDAKNSTLDDEFRKLLWEWFTVKLVVIEDSHATGEQIVQRICDETPPGIYNRIMGMQNIKGTGLDFVYRWEAWLACHTACEQLLSNDPVASREGLRALAGFQEFGLLSEWHVRDALEKLRERPAAQSELFQAELPLIEKNLETALEAARSATTTIRQSGWVSKLTDAVEAFLDAGDAIKRRKIANQIYKDLVAQRISHQRAALELQKLNKRQKGGWLNKRISEMIDPWRQTPSDPQAEAAS